MWEITNSITVHDPTLNYHEMSEKQYSIYANKMTDMLEGLQARFLDTQIHADYLHNFSSPFGISNGNTPKNSK
jgi:hypothetical protein